MTATPLGLQRFSFTALPNEPRKGSYSSKPFSCSLTLCSYIYQRLTPTPSTTPPRSTKRPLRHFLRPQKCPRIRAPPPAIEDGQLEQLDWLVAWLLQYSRQVGTGPGSHKEWWGDCTQNYTPDWGNDIIRILANIEQGSSNSCLGRRWPEPSIQIILGKGSKPPSAQDFITQGMRNLLGRIPSPTNKTWLIDTHMNRWRWQKEVYYDISLILTKMHLCGPQKNKHMINDNTWMIQAISQRILLSWTLKTVNPKP